jgi:O-acetyl-ADP-ribose deacetylase
MSFKSKMYSPISHLTIVFTRFSIIYCVDTISRRVLSLEVTIKSSVLRLIEGDITEQSTDAIVNAANSSLMGGGGVDGAIHRAGGPSILDECKKIRAEKGRLPAGQAVITTGGNLPSRYVIHTVGPIWHGGNNNEAEVLASAYKESLLLAVKQGLTSICFPSISTGAYGYPLDEAAQVALKTVTDFLKQDTSLKQVTFVLFDQRTFLTYCKALKELHLSK